MTNYWRAWLCLPIVLLPALTGLPDGPLAVVYGLLIWFLLNDMNFLLHQHIHYPMTTSKTQNVVRNNFGFHTGYHYHPKAHWTELPALHRETREKIPRQFISHRIWTGYWTPPLVIHALKTLTRKLTV